MRCPVLVHEFPEGTWGISYQGRLLARYGRDGHLLSTAAAVGRWAGRLAHRRSALVGTKSGAPPAAPPAVLHTLEVAGCHEERSPPRRGLILTGPHPAPRARSVSVWSTAPHLPKAKVEVISDVQPSGQHVTAYDPDLCKCQ